MATISGLNLSAAGAFAKAADTPKAQPVVKLNQTWAWRRRTYLVGSARRMQIRPVGAAPEGLSDKVAESIKNAEEACSGDPTSGECVAAWDEVEELSAAASHERDKKKGSDPLENYCKDNPETDECRTYDN
uniref:CP12 domain-containing family protein n=1 Tax=Rhizophora mucronata TaxID=61149 RepID=A0A2P2JAL9_RHIMU